MREQKLKIGIKMFKHDKGDWSLGMEISKSNGKPYVYIHLLKWVIYIGETWK